MIVEINHWKPCDASWDYDIKFLGKDEFGIRHFETDGISEHFKLCEPGTNESDKLDGPYLARIDVAMAGGYERALKTALWIRECCNSHEIPTA